MGTDPRRIPINMLAGSFSSRFRGALNITPGGAIPWGRGRASAHTRARKGDHSCGCSNGSVSGGSVRWVGAWLGSEVRGRGRRGGRGLVAPGGDHPGFVHHTVRTLCGLIPSGYKIGGSSSLSFLLHSEGNQVIDPRARPVAGNAPRKVGTTCWYLPNTPPPPPQLLLLTTPGVTTLRRRDT